MLKNYIKTAFRNITKNKVYSLINIFGLAIGVAACIMIMLYVSNELSYDKFNKNYKQIFRVQADVVINGKESKMALTPSPLGSTLVREFPEVLQYTRIMPSSNMLIRYKNNVFNETRFYWADSTLFNVFTLPFVKGNPKTALNQPHTVVLTESLAKKYFGSENPMGKIMKFEDGTPYTVSGIIKDCPENSHFKYDIFASMASVEFGNSPFWFNNNFYTYILLKKGTSVKGFEAKTFEIIKKYMSPQLYQTLGVHYSDWKKQGNSYKFFLEPLGKIHLYSHLEHELEPNGDIKYVYIFSIVALFILLIACINFMNLSIARSATRSKEVGVRKVLGSNKLQLIKQFMIESFVLTFFSILVAAAIVEISLPIFNNLSGMHLNASYFNNWIAIPGLFLTVLIVGVIAGSYPSFFLSSFQPAKVLKGKLSGNKGSLLRSGLVIFQFSISIILFIGTFIIFNQLKYIQNTKLGFDKEHVLVIKRAWALENHAATFKNELVKNTGIQSATNSNNVPGKSFGQMLIKAEGVDAADQYLFANMSTGYDFLKTMGIGLKAGRYFSPQHPADTLSAVLNESAVKELNLKNPIGKRIIAVGRNTAYTIIGVMKDFHFESLHEKIRPLIISLEKGQTAYLPVRISSNNIAGTVSFIKSEWKKFVPNKPFEFYFLDSEFNHLYINEQKTGEFFTAFSILAIFIACLGLFGLAAFTAERRTKEIGIRKALGCSVGGIIYMLSKEFTKWVLIANVIAWPVAYYLMNNWLSDFAYRITITPWIFLLSGAIAFIIALLTVITHALKAAMVNPVESLKYE